MSTAAARKMSAARFRQRAAEVVGRLHTEAGAFGPDDPSPTVRKARAAHDPLYFCRTYLPHYFHDAFASFHHELVELLTPRGSAVVPVAVAA
ncbi:MAG: hypothetical protein ABIK12_06790, partial [Pseudomonadota bacterium]